MDDLDEQVPEADVVERVRQGDRDATVELWTRHYPAVLLAARRVTRQPRDAEEIASDAFSGMLSALSTGAGPTTSVRAYLVTSVRNLAASRARRSSSSDVITDDVTVFDRATPDTTVHMSELELVRVAFADLPRRWQIVLWRTAVDKDSNIEVGEAMGLSPNGVAALAKRARRGFRLSYLRAHLSDRGVDAACKPFVDGLPDFAVAQAGAPAALVEHVAGCPRCTSRVEELRRVDTNFAGLLGPAVLGLVPSKVLLGVSGAGAGAATAQSAPVPHLWARPSMRWALGSAGVAGAAVAIAIAMASGPELVAPPVGGTTAARPTALPTTVPTSPAPSLTTQPPSPSTTSRPRASPRPTPTASTRTVIAPPPTRPAPTTTAPRMSPLTVDLGIGGTQADTALDVTAAVQGAVGTLHLTIEVPAGVALVAAEGDWKSCTQSGVTISCTASNAAAARWAGTIRTAWAEDAEGQVRAAVEGTYANGSPARGSVETTWPPDS